MSAATTLLRKKVWQYTMAGSKKKVRQKADPKGNHIVEGGNPDEFYTHHPSWNFFSCDKDKWSLFSEEVKNIFWSEILPHLQGLEKQTWSAILLQGKKQNHTINVLEINKIASDRLCELHIEAESLVSLRITSRHRIYGYMNGAVFCVLWVDLEHGDNDVCVCRSHKKHT